MYYAKSEDPDKTPHFCVVISGSALLAYVPFMLSSPVNQLTYGQNGYYMSSTDLTRMSPILTKVQWKWPMKAKMDPTTCTTPVF